MKPDFVFSIGLLRGSPERQNCKIVHTRPSFPNLPLPAPGTCHPSASRDARMPLPPFPLIPPALLEARGLHFGYRTGQPVLEAVDLSLPAGSLTVLLGPNGSGKSTLLRLLLGQETPWQGQIELAGKPLHHDTPRQRARRMAFVPQRGALPGGFSVAQTVFMGRYPHGESFDHAAAVIHGALEAMDLQALADRPLGELSGGQQRRVLIARALAQLAGTGQVLLLDEPTAGLDLAHVQALMQQVRACCHSGLAVVMVLHDVTLASAWADRACLLANGRVQAQGHWDQVFQPEVLSPVYGVAFDWWPRPAPARPMLIPRPDPTIAPLP